MRRRLMNGPTNKPKIRVGIGGWEISTTIAGLVVVIGLLMESGSEIHLSWTLHRWPPRELWGAILVAIGVFAEVVIGIIIARSSKREQIDANERIREAEQAVSEAKEQATRAERKLAWGHISQEQHDAIRRALEGSELAGKNIRVLGLPDNKLVYEYAYKLRFLFPETGPQHASLACILHPGHEPPGLHIVGTNPMLADLLSKILKEHGIDVASTNTVPLFPDGNKAEVELHVNARP